MEYLSILLLIIIIAIFFEHKYNLRLYHSRKERIIVVISLFLAGILWDYYAVARGHWIYPGSGLVGVFIFRLPIEDFLFMLVVPYSVLITYKFYDTRIK